MKLIPIFIAIAIAFISCGKPLVRMADTILPAPMVLHDDHQVTAKTDNYDSVSTRIEYRHDTTNKCDSVATTTVQIKKVYSVVKSFDTIKIPVPTPYMVRDTIYREHNNPIPYAKWKIYGWMLLGALLGGGIVLGVVRLSGIFK
jgi:hypothetical protein